MITPKLYYPFAIFWYGFSGLLGDVMSRILLTIIYFVIVLPVGLIRRLSGRDTLKLKDFKRSAGSVMQQRNHTFVKADLEKPF